MCILCSKVMPKWLCYKVMLLTVFQSDPVLPYHPKIPQVNLDSLPGSFRAVGQQICSMCGCPNGFLDDPTGDAALPRLLQRCWATGGRWENLGPSLADLGRCDVQTSEGFVQTVDIPPLPSTTVELMCMYI